MGANELRLTVHVYKYKMENHTDEPSIRVFLEQITEECAATPQPSGWLLRI